MILTVTLNAALDTTYGVDALVPGTSHRVQNMHVRAGGKGINVARVLHTLGRDVTVAGFVGGATGIALRADLAAAGMDDQLITIAGETRRTLTVTLARPGDATVFNEAGPPVTPNEWAAFRASFDGLVRRADVIVLSGSIPPGVPTDAYGQLVAAALGRPCIVDADGPALVAALSAGPDLVKPNAAELVTTTGVAEPLTAASLLRERGARAVVASLGVEGLLALTPEGAWRARPSARLSGNPTGAGDACVAALAMGLADGAPWPDRLRDAVALSAAAVLAPVAGDVNLLAYRRFHPTVELEGIDASHTDC